MWCQNTAVCSIVSSQNTRVTDGRTDRILITKTDCASMQRCAVKTTNLDDLELLGAASSQTEDEPDIVRLCGEIMAA